MGGQPIEEIIEEINAAVAELMGINEEERSKDLVTLRVLRGDYDVYYRFERDFPLHHLMLDYCNRLGSEYGAVRFTFNGARLPGAKTPNDLQMKDGDVIVARVDKTGG